MDYESLPMRSLGKTNNTLTAIAQLKKWCDNITKKHKKSQSKVEKLKLSELHEARTVKGQFWNVTETCWFAVDQKSSTDFSKPISQHMKLQKQLQNHYCSPSWEKANWGWQLGCINAKNCYSLPSLLPGDPRGIPVDTFGGMTTGQDHKFASKVFSGFNQHSTTCGSNLFYVDSAQDCFSVDSKGHQMQKTEKGNDSTLNHGSRAPALGVKHRQQKWGISGFSHFLWEKQLNWDWA